MQKGLYLPEIIERKFFSSLGNPFWSRKYRRKNKEQRTKNKRDSAMSKSENFFMLMVCTELQAYVAYK